MPNVRQKWARLVQQPMLTCWQASTSWPLVASWKEPARPPRRLRDSRMVTRKPRGASAAAVARPASPPPTIRTRLFIVQRRSPPPPRRQRPQRQPHLAPTAHPRPAAEHVVVAALDHVEQR